MLPMFCGSLPTSVPMLSVGLSLVTDIGQGHYRHGYRLQALVTDIGNRCRSGRHRCRYRCGGQPSEPSVPRVFYQHRLPMSFGSIPTSVPISWAVKLALWVLRTRVTDVGRGDTDVGTDVRPRPPPTSVTDVDRCWTTSVPKLVYPRP